MLNQLNNEDRINAINKKINLHLKNLANGNGSFEETNLMINALKEELDKIDQ